MIGERLSPVLVEIENTLWEFESSEQGKPDYPKEAFRAICKIFISAIMDKMWELHEDENIRMVDRENMATSAGEEIRKLVKNFTDIDTFDLYK